MADRLLGSWATASASFHLAALDCDFFSPEYSLLLTDPEHLLSLGSMSGPSTTYSLATLKRALRKAVQQTLRAIPSSAVEAQCAPFFPSQLGSPLR